jgi:hypothetical protein
MCVCDAVLAICVGCVSVWLCVCVSVRACVCVCVGLPWSASVYAVPAAVLYCDCAYTCIHWHYPHTSRHSLRARYSREKQRVVWGHGRKHARAHTHTLQEATLNTTFNGTLSSPTDLLGRGASIDRSEVLMGTPGWDSSAQNQGGVLGAVADGGAHVIASWVWIEVVVGTTFGILIGVVLTTWTLFRLGVFVR